MKICIIAPNEEYLEQAGARIRYFRISEYIESSGVTFDVRSLDTIDLTKSLKYDIYIISKCYDARSIIFANQVKASDKILAVDLFDDYFSQKDDPRFSRLRQWLSELLPLCNFALCSTEVMKDVVNKFKPDLPVNILNDPAEHLDFELIKETLEKKRALLAETKTLKIGWFGIGDNPNFPVGLSDLSEASEDLIQLRSLNFKIKFEILTNKRSLTSDAMISLSKLPFEYSIELWREEREKQKLSEWLICIIPVNGQPFSFAKSLNRAVTALTSSTQILSIGYPLYEPLGDFIYRDVVDFIEDIENNAPFKHSAYSIEKYKGKINEYANPKIESENFISFIRKIYNSDKRVHNKEQSSFAVIHGKVSNIQSHKLAQRLGQLSVASPYCKLKLGFNIRLILDSESEKIKVLVCSKTLDRSFSQLKVFASKDKDFAGAKYFKISESFFNCNLAYTNTESINRFSPIGMIQSYNTIQNISVDILEEILPDINYTLSEQSKESWTFERRTLDRTIEPA